jgi:hypothetical protein
LSIHEMIIICLPTFITPGGTSGGFPKSVERPPFIIARLSNYENILLALPVRNEGSVKVRA